MTQFHSFQCCWVYVHRNIRLIRDGEPTTATLTFTQLLNSALIQYGGRTNTQNRGRTNTQNRGRTNTQNGGRTNTQYGGRTNTQYKYPVRMENKYPEQRENKYLERRENKYPERRENKYPVQIPRTEGEQVSPLHEPLAPGVDWVISVSTRAIRRNGTALTPV